jgi:hypothetical protein
MIAEAARTFLDEMQAVGFTLSGAISGVPANASRTGSRYRA